MLISLTKLFHGTLIYTVLTMYYMCTYGDKNMLMPVFLRASVRSTVVSTTLGEAIISVVNVYD